MVDRLSRVVDKLPRVVVRHPRRRDNTPIVVDRQSILVDKLPRQVDRQPRVVDRLPRHVDKQLDNKNPQTNNELQAHCKRAKRQQHFCKELVLNHKTSAIQNIETNTNDTKARQHRGFLQQGFCKRQAEYQMLNNKLSLSF